jgi:hypothetical protein
MSRSRRKTPVYAVASARSEAVDKRLWHQRWRAWVRDQLAASGPGGDPQPLDRRAVSDPWSMAKDGKRWIGLHRLREAAESAAAHAGRPESERKSLQARLLAKWRAK